MSVYIYLDDGTSVEVTQSGIQGPSELLVSLAEAIRAGDDMGSIAVDTPAGPAVIRTRRITMIREMDL